MTRRDRLTRAVDALVRNRRPPRFPADGEEAASLHAAAALGAGRPGADLPTPAFLAQLEARLHAEVDAGSRRRVSRRALMRAGGVGAAAAVAGALLDRTVLGGTTDAPPADGPLVTGAGRWVPVLADGELPPGSVVRFTAGAVEGIAVNRAGRLTALSAVCTHMGCLLRPNAAAGSLDCPCHTAAFTLDGAPVNREYLKPLPVIDVRSRAGHIEVHIPEQA